MKRAQALAENLVIELEDGSLHDALFALLDALARRGGRIHAQLEAAIRNIPADTPGPEQFEGDLGDASTWGLPAWQPGLGIGPYLGRVRQALTEVGRIDTRDKAVTLATLLHLQNSVKGATRDAYLLSLLDLLRSHSSAADVVPSHRRGAAKVGGDLH
jgi:hypothetical protein